MVICVVHHKLQSDFLQQTKNTEKQKLVFSLIANEGYTQKNLKASEICYSNSFTFVSTSFYYLSHIHLQATTSCPDLFLP